MTSSSFIRKTFFFSKLLSLQRSCIDPESAMVYQVWVNLQIKNGFDNQYCLYFVFFIVWASKAT